jgi:DNA repair ATPase RecN
MFHSSNADLLEVITEVQSSSHGTIASVMELDEWQKRLTKLLSDALQRYFEINISAKKYSVHVNSLKEKIGNIDHFLQRLEISEQKSDDITATCDALRYVYMYSMLHCWHVSYIFKSPQQFYDHTPS